MSAPLPTTAPLDAAVARLVERMRPYLHRPEVLLDQIRRLQHHATLASLDPRPVTTTHGGGQAVKVFDLDRYRHLPVECHDDDDTPGAA